MVFCHKQKNMARLKKLVLVVDENAVNQVLKMLTAIAELSQKKIEVASEDEIEAMSEKEDAVNDNKSSEGFKGNNAQVADDPEYKLLFSEKGRRVLNQLRDIQVLDDNYQPDHLSWTKKGYLAYQIAFKLGITRVWKIMGGFWHLDSHSLKTGRDKAESTLKIQTFEEKIKPIFG